MLKRGDVFIIFHELNVVYRFVYCLCPFILMRIEIILSRYALIKTIYVIIL